MTIRCDAIEEARRSGKQVLVGYRPTTKVARAREMSETRGFMRVLVDADSQRIPGAVVFGIGGDEIVHSVLLATRPACRGMTTEADSLRQDRTE